MSGMERNKGVLRLAKKPAKELFEEHCPGEQLPDYCRGNYEEYLCYETENAFVLLDDKLYYIDYEVKAGDCYGFSDVNTLDDGSIAFHTMHYNGGGSLQEVLEEALKNNTD